MPSSDTHSLHFDVLPPSHWLSLKPARETSRLHLQHTLLSCVASASVRLLVSKPSILGPAREYEPRLPSSPFRFYTTTKTKALDLLLPSQLLLLPLGRSFDCLHSEQVLAKLLYAGLFTRINNSQGLNPVSSNITKSDFRRYVRRVSLLVGTALQVQLPRLASRHPVRAHSPQRAAAPAW